MIGICCSFKPPSVISPGLGQISLGWALGGILRKLAPSVFLPGPGLLVGRDQKRRMPSKCYLIKNFKLYILVK